MHKPILAILACSASFAADLPLCLSDNNYASQYAYDKAAADVKYKGKPLIIKGIVDSVRLNPREMDLKGDGFHYVRCSGQNFSSLRPGQSITLQCKGDGTENPITVSSCSVVPASTPCKEEQKPVVNLNSPNLVTLTITPVIRAQSIVISGTTNLKDGAFISWEIEHELAMHQALGQMCADNGNTVVKGGRYSALVSIAKCPRGKIKVWAGFLTIGNQPQWVKNQYGALGEKIEGPGVKLGSMKTKSVEVEKTVVRP